MFDQSGMTNLFWMKPAVSNSACHLVNWVFRKTFCGEKGVMHGLLPLLTLHFTPSPLPHFTPSNSFSLLFTLHFQFSFSPPFTSYFTRLPLILHLQTLPLPHSLDILIFYPFSHSLFTLCTTHLPPYFSFSHLIASHFSLFLTHLQPYFTLSTHFTPPLFILPTTNLKCSPFTLSEFT